MSDWVFKCIFPGKDVLGRWTGENPSFLAIYFWQYIAIPPEGKVKPTGTGPLPWEVLPKPQLLLSRHFLSEHRSSLTFPHLPWKGSSSVEQNQSIKAAAFPQNGNWDGQRRPSPFPRMPQIKAQTGVLLSQASQEKRRQSRNHVQDEFVPNRDLRVGHQNSLKFRGALYLQLS